MSGEKDPYVGHAILVRDFGPTEEHLDDDEQWEVEPAEAWRDHIQYNTKIGGRTIVIQIPRDILQKLIDLPSVD